MKSSSIFRKAWNYVAPRVKSRLQSDYARRLRNDQSYFARQEVVHDLPEIFQDGPIADSFNDNS